MSGFTVCLLVLLIGGVAPALWLSSTGGPANRLVGVEMLSSVAVAAWMVLAQVVGESYELIVPLVLVPLSFAGTLVFTRLINEPEQ